MTLQYAFHREGVKRQPVIASAAKRREAIPMRLLRSPLRGSLAMTGNNFRILAITSLVLSAGFFATGCGEVTYPKEKLRESVIKLCDDEYGVNIDAKVVGSTLALYLPLANLFDVTLNLSEAAQEKVQDVLLGASRVVLSTDADIKFYCIITQDIRLPEIQLVITKYTDDVKRAFYRDISRGEYFKRTLIDINENPQAKKEQAIVNVFNKMKLDREMQEKVLDDFFRSAPSSLEGVGYWNGKFYIKDITLAEFIAEQIASRVKMRFRESEDLKRYSLKMVEGSFVDENELKLFLVNFSAETLLFVLDPKERLPMEKDIFGNIFEEASDVIYAYKFKDFNLVKILEKNYNRKLLVSKEDLYLFKKRRLSLGAVLGGIS